MKVNKTGRKTFDFQDKRESMHFSVNLGILC